MTRRYYCYQEVGCFEVYLECESIGPDEVVISGVYEDEIGGPDLLGSRDVSRRLIAAAVADHAGRDREFTACLWGAEQADRPTQPWDREDYHALSARQLGVGAYA